MNKEYIIGRSSSTIHEDVLSDIRTILLDKYIIPPNTNISLIPTELTEAFKNLNAVNIRKGVKIGGITGTCIPYVKEELDILTLEMFDKVFKEEY